MNSGMVTSLVATVILALMHGFGKALRDTVAHHFPESIFNRATDPRAWKWYRSDWQDRPAHKIVPLWDAWHFGDFWASAAPIVWALVAGVNMGLFLVYCIIFLWTFLYLYKVKFIS